MAWLGQARAAGATVLIGDPGRSYFPREGLTKLAQYEVPTTRELEDMEVERTSRVGNALEAAYWQARHSS